MGALHDGHLSLVEESIAKCQNTIVSIYINPAQFTPGDDLERYPKMIFVFQISSKGDPNCSYSCFVDNQRFILSPNPATEYACEINNQNIIIESIFFIASP